MRGHVGIWFIVTQRPGLHSKIYAIVYIHYNAYLERERDPGGKMQGRIWLIISTSPLKLGTTAYAFLTYLPIHDDGSVLKRRHFALGTESQKRVKLLHTTGSVRHSYMSKP